MTDLAANCDLAGPGQDCADDEALCVGDVGNYPSFDYSMKDVRRAGKIVASNPPLCPETVEAFTIVNNYRDSHLFPMRSVRGTVTWHMGRNDLAGVTGARLKRM
jgi:hypothetical protein